MKAFEIALKLVSLTSFFWMGTGIPIRVFKMLAEADSESMDTLPLVFRCISVIH